MLSHREIKEKAKSELRSLNVMFMVIIGVINVVFYSLLDRKSGNMFNIFIYNLSIYITFKAYTRKDIKVEKLFVVCLVEFVRSILALILLLAFIVPGVWFIVVTSLYKEIYFTEDISIKEAIRKSYNLARYHVGDLFRFYLTFILWVVLVGLTYGAVNAFVIPYLHIASYNYYKELLKENYISMI